MHRRSIVAHDGRELNAFISVDHPDAPDVVVVLPFGARQAMLERCYAALRPHFNVVTWESRFVLDIERDAHTDGFAAHAHASDLASVIRGARPGGRSGPVDVIAYCSGAGVAMLAALHHPETIARMVLVSGEYLLPAEVSAPTDVQRQMDILLSLAARSPTLAGSVQEKISAAQLRNPNEFQAFLSEPFSSGPHLHRYGINYLAYRDVDLVEVAKKIEHHALSIVATEDRHVDPAGSLAIGECLRHSAGSVAISGDHYALCRGNADVVKHIVDFLVAHEVDASM
ncbi:serine aminopeptidase domain-containing protein [Burkholderia ambifaria]|uniref:serine aminopeptidase domain-containing protein n=1 Tax=Burkholderia ambifaria TaxID=152480 RepID=UPI00158BDC0E|nr:alpha/beta hydrolase [Burkholderia ambifaria]